jgi:MIP family channel proteins
MPASNRHEISISTVDDGSTTGSYDARRLRTNDMELGVTEAIHKHVTRHVVAAKPVSQRRLDFEHSRPRWLREMAAEATGVFLFVYPALGSVAAFTLNGEKAAFGSLLQIGFAFAIGIALAVIICGPVSGGHLNPAITICFAMYKGFPWKKVPHYIFSQTFGGFCAAMMIMIQYWEQMQTLKGQLLAKGHTSMNFEGGPGSILCSFPHPEQTNLGFLFLIEFFVDSFLALVIWATLDPSNPFIAPSSAPFVIGLGYALMVWGFADITISTNLARDLGARIVAAIFYGADAFSYNHYSWIAMLVNIPASIFAVSYYELMMKDSMVNIANGHAEHENGTDGLMRHLTKTGSWEDRMEKPRGRHTEYVSRKETV